MIHQCPSCGRDIAEERSVSVWEDSDEGAVEKFVPMMIPVEGSTISEHLDRAPAVVCGGCGRTVVLLKGRT